MAKRWYVIHTYSGLREQGQGRPRAPHRDLGPQDPIVDIRSRPRRSPEIKDGGKRETKESKVFPSYVLVRMEIDDNTWAVVRNTPGVTGFVGLDGKPTPLRRDEFDKIMREVQEGRRRPQAHPPTS